MENRTPYHTEQPPVELDRAMWGAIRQALLIALAAIEARWGFDRSREPKRKK